MSHAHRRLLDLLAGWADYVGKCAGSPEPHPGVTKDEYEAESEAIHDLYQEAGRLEEMSDAAIHDFIDNRIFPILFRGVAA